MIKDLFVMILGVILIVCLLVGLSNFVPFYGCKIKAERQEMEWSYGIFQGCMVKQDNKWIDYDRLRYTKE